MITNGDRVEINSLLENEAPVMISPDAEQKLTDWGYMPEDISDLAEIMERYDYTQCVTKAKSLIKNPFVLDKEREKIIVPSFFDMMNRGLGNCNDLSANLLVELELREFNRRNGKNLELARVNGSAPEFFKGRNSHFWLSLFKKQDSNQYISSEDVANGCIIDPSFSLITTAKDSHYVANREGITFADEVVRIEARADFLLNYLVFYPKEKKYVSDPSWNAPGIAMGLSSDRSTAFGLSFGVDYDRNKIKPVLNVLDETGYRNLYLWNEGTQDIQRIGRPTDRVLALNQNVAAEAKNVLGVFEDATYVDISKVKKASYPGDRDNFNIKI